MVSKAGHVTHRLISWTNSPTDTVGPLRSYTVAFRTTWTNEQRSDLSWRLRLGLYYGAINPKNGNGYFQFWGSWEWAKEIRLGCVSRYGTPKCSSYFFGTFDAFLVWMEMSLHIGAVLSPTPQAADAQPRQATLLPCIDAQASRMEIYGVSNKKHRPLRKVVMFKRKITLLLVYSSSTMFLG